MVRFCLQNSIIFGQLQVLSLNSKQVFMIYLDVFNSHGHYNKYPPMHHHLGERKFSFSIVVPSGGQLFHTSLLVAAGTPAQSLLATTPFHFAFSWSPLCGFHLFPCKYSCHQIQIHLTQGKLHITILNSTHKGLSSRKATAKDST